MFTFNIQIGGNRNAMEFFKSQPDWNDSMTIEQKYNTKAAALYRDKVNEIDFLVNKHFIITVACLQILNLARGEQWSPTKSSAKDYNVDHMKM